MRTVPTRRSPTSTAASAAAKAALAHAEPTPFWLDQDGRPEPRPSLSSDATADLVIVGGGFTGLWAAIQAKEDDPSRDVVLLESGRVADGASGRNGGFVSASLTHGLANGVRHFPDEVHRLHQLGLDNHAGLLASLDRYGIDAQVERTGELTFATAPWQVAELAMGLSLHLRFGERAELLDAESARQAVHSPTYHGALWAHDGVALVDPARLAWGLLAAAASLGVRVQSPLFPPLLLTSRTLPISTPRSAPLTMSYTVRAATDAAVIASISTPV